MRTYVLTHLNDAVLLCDLDALVSEERGTLAAVVAHLAEVDARRLYLPAGFPSMYAYCVQKLGWSEQAALKRLRAARAARRFPVIFEALAAGRLHLTAVVLLAPYLTAENADEFLAAAAHRTRGEIEELIAGWFPRSNVDPRLEALTLDSLSTSQLPLETVISPSSSQLLSPGTVSTGGDTDAARSARAPQPAPQELRPRPLALEAPQASRIKPISPERFVIQFTIGKETREKLRHVQELLGHQLPSGDLAQVFDRALDVLTRQLEKKKFAAAEKPRPRSGARSRRAGTVPGDSSSANPRYIPAPVKRAVWERDGGRCTFMNAAGERCRARRMLEFDHVEPVACGGRATVEGLRLLCRGHNQYEAERRFGANFMRGKREHARRRPAAPANAGQDAPRPAASAPRELRAGIRIHEQHLAARTSPQIHAEESGQWVMAGLRNLGFRAGEARRAAEYCRTLRDCTVEDQMRAALRLLCPAPG